MPSQHNSHQQQADQKGGGEMVISHGASQFTTENQDVVARLSAPRAKNGDRFREYQRILKGLPSAKWIIEADDFFKKKVAKPKWNDQTTLFNNVGQCAHSRSYFDRWRDRASDYIPNVGKLTSTWLIGNIPEGDEGLETVHSPVRKILYSHCHHSTTPRQKYVTDSSYQSVVRWPPPVERADIVAGIGYGSKYNAVTHSNFREYFGKHKKHRKLWESVNESHNALVRSSIEAANKNKVRRSASDGNMRQIQVQIANTSPRVSDPLKGGSFGRGGLSSTHQTSSTDRNVPSSLEGTLYSTTGWTKALDK